MNHTQHTHGYGFDEDGNPVRIEEFPHGEVADRLDGKPAGMDNHHVASIAVASVMSFAFSRGACEGKNKFRESLRGAAARMLAMAWVWRHPQTQSFESIHQLAKAHGVHHRSIHALAREYAEANGIPLELTRKRWGGGDMRLHTPTDGQNDSGHHRSPS